jgi:uncharacterized membrane protein
MVKQTAEQKLTGMMEGYDSRVVRHLNAEFEQSTSRGDRFADAVASRVGSWPFIIVQSGILMFWMAWNILGPTRLHFDAPPFIGMNLLLSFQAGYTAPFIMMSANRMAKREHLEAEIDYAVNYKAEEEIADMQADLHHIYEHLEQIAVQNRDLATENREIVAQNRELQAKLSDLLTRLGHN